MMEAYFLVMVSISAVFSWAVARRGKSRIGLRIVIWVATAGVLLSMLLGSMALLLQTILTLIVLALVGSFHVQPRHAVIAIAATAPIAFGAVAALTARERSILLRGFPIVSVADRLSYEASERATDVAPASQTEIDESPAVLSPNTEQRLAKIEETRGSPFRRELLLRRLHESKFMAFVAAEGFGPERMPHVRRSSLQQPEINPVKPPRRPETIEPPTAIQNPQLVEDDRAAPSALVSQLHEFGVSDFVNPSRMGYVKARQQVAGFTPHALTQMPAGDRGLLADWQVSRLDLVSLLKFGFPRVYLSDHLPRMEELRNAETRPVDEFEQRALEQLRGGEDIVVDQHLNTIRMVGAIRAAKQCLDCHTVRRGELLGAFSYLLDRKKPIAPPKAEAKPIL